MGCPFEKEPSTDTEEKHNVFHCFRYVKVAAMSKSSQTCTSECKPKNSCVYFSSQISTFHRDIMEEKKIDLGSVVGRGGLGVLTWREEECLILGGRELPMLYRGRAGGAGETH